MILLTVNHTVYEYNEPILLSQAIQKAGLSFSMPCGGKHTCGKCKVTANGLLSEITNEERAFLSNAEIESGVRLACFTYAVGDAEITLTGKREESKDLYAFI